MYGQGINGNISKVLADCIVERAAGIARIFLSVNDALP